MPYVEFERRGGSRQRPGLCFRLSENLYIATYIPLDIGPQRAMSRYEGGILESWLQDSSVESLHSDLEPLRALACRGLCRDFLYVRNRTLTYVPASGRRYTRTGEVKVRGWFRDVTDTRSMAQSARWFRDERGEGDAPTTTPTRPTPPTTRAVDAWRSDRCRLGGHR
jgi:hypothetical protein